MDADKASQLRQPFKPEQIGKVPRSACSACSQSRTKVCDKHKKEKCRVCGQYLTTAHIHLDYVGHAAVTERLLQVDPDWTWKPMAIDAQGAPLLDKTGGLWIHLTVCGITRPGYGDETNGKGMKEVIGDAIRNAAMRFGVGLDLWSKEKLVGDEPPQEGQDSQRPPQGAARPAQGGQRPQGQRQAPPQGQERPQGQRQPSQAPREEGLSPLDRKIAELRDQADKAGGLAGDVDFFIAHSMKRDLAAMNEGACNFVARKIADGSLVSWCRKNRPAEGAAA